MTKPVSGRSWSLDSNIILYSIDESPAALLKRERSQTLLSLSMAQGNVLAAQVCGEVFRVLHSKLRLPPLGVLDFLNRVMDCHQVAQASPAVFKAAMYLCAQTKRQFWDCVIIATCAEHGVKRLYTEDTGAEPYTVLGLELVNPFILENLDEAQLEPR